ncbi:MAG TPA: DUF5668 domain-containing protein [Candidatus Limnocylindrales bacterium]|nr:DUF5668 domain-containing protein [Candidatus Limnocylindrales bacterium]
MTPRRGLIWPVLLIVLGATFLAANFGLIAPFSVLALLSLWPLILIIVGIDMAIGSRWPAAALGADLLIVAAGIALVALGPSSPLGVAPFFGGAADGTGTNTVDVARSDVKTLALRVTAGAGTVELRGQSGALVHAESDREDLRLRSATRTGDREDVRVDQGAGGGFRIGPATSSHVKMQVANDVPTSLILDGGAGEFTIDASDIKLTDARVSVGAASLHVVLPRPTGDVSFTISAGASSISIEIPDGVEARITTSGGLTSTHVENSRVLGSQTTGYASATDRVTIRISAGATSITIR